MSKQWIPLKKEQYPHKRTNGDVRMGNKILKMMDYKRYVDLSHVPVYDNKRNLVGFDTITSKLVVKDDVGKVTTIMGGDFTSGSNWEAIV